jgi:putative SOS response-associated peptidase YedK
MNGLPLAFAGIWKRVGDHLEATVITTTPNVEMAGIHDRMPVILSTEGCNNWLSPDPLSPDEHRRLLCPSADAILTRWPVGRSVGSVRNSYPGLIDAIEELPREITPDLFE